MASSLTQKDPITCHVLDTITGRPAPSMNVTLQCLSDTSKMFKATTNPDGRIANWHLESFGSVESVLSKKGESVWELKFQTEEFYGVGKTFWPHVTLTFRVRPGEHYHVPLLLGPYSYTTYRGS